MRIFLCLSLLSPPAPLMTGKEQCLHLSHLQSCSQTQVQPKAGKGLLLDGLYKPLFVLFVLTPILIASVVSFSRGLQLSAPQPSALAPTYVKCISAVLC